MADELDMENRDPLSLNTHVKVNFEEVLAEPEGVRSIDCLWRNSYTCFNGGKNCCYKFMTTICGLCIALFWGCQAACLAFDMVWCTTPQILFQRIQLLALSKLYTAYVDCCVAPCCRGCGEIFHHFGKSKE